MRAALFMAALALCAGCGEKDDGKGKDPAVAARCDAAALAAVRSQLAAVPEAQPSAGSPARVMEGDGARTPGAVRLRFFEDERGDVHAQVGDQPAVLAGEAGSSKTLVQQLLTALDGAPARAIELETFAGLSPIALQPFLTAFDPAVELRLVVDQVKPPPRDGVKPWATKMYDGLRAVPSAQRAGEIQKSLVRAMGGRCFQILDRTLAASQSDSATLRNALPESLEACGCEKADLGTTAWVYQLMVLRSYEPAWLRLRLDTGGARLSETRTMEDVARGLAALTPEQRQKGVWIVP